MLPFQEFHRDQLTDEQYEVRERFRGELIHVLKEQMTRRQLLRYGGFAGMSLSALWALACQPAPREVGKPTPIPEVPTAPLAVGPTAPPAAPTPTPAPPTPTKPPARKPEIVMSHVADPEHFDPAKAQPSSYGYLRQISSALIRYKHPSPELVPDLASEWSVTPDGKSYTFKLRKGVKWQKGYGELKASDVKYCYERVKDPKVGSPYRSPFGYLDHVETPDDYTVKLVMGKPFSAFVYYLPEKAAIVAPEAAIKKFGDDYGTAPDKIVGLGPYEFKEWKSREYMVYEADPGYWGDKPKITKVTSRWVSDQLVAAMALEKGELDATGVQAEDVKRLAANPKLTVYIGKKVGAMTVYFHTFKKPTDDLRVRQALAHAINKDDLVKAHDNLVEPLNSTLGRMLFGYYKDTPEYKYDVAKAKALLKEAGYEKGFELPVITTRTGQYASAAEVNAAQWNKIGVTVKMDVYPNWPSYQDPQWGGRWIVSYYELTRAPHPYLMYWDRWHSASFPKDMAWYKGVDDLLDKLAVTFDEKEQIELAKQIQVKTHYTDASAIPLFNTITPWAHQKWLKGLSVSPQHGFKWDVTYIEE